MCMLKSCIILFLIQCFYSFFPYFIFLLDILFICISKVIPFPGFPSENSLSHLPSHCLLTHPLPLPCPGIPLHWDIEPSQDQGPLLPLMPDKAILCYICFWSYGSLHVYSLVVGLSPLELSGVWLVDIVVLPMSCKLLQLFGSFP